MILPKRKNQEGQLEISLITGGTLAATNNIDPKMNTTLAKIAMTLESLESVILLL